MTIKKRLSDSAVIAIIESSKSSNEEARRYDISPTTIRRIRRGELYASVCPEIPRWTKDETKMRPVKSCLNCFHMIEEFDDKYVWLLCHCKAKNLKPCAQAEIKNTGEKRKLAIGLARGCQHFDLIGAQK